MERELGVWVGAKVFTVVYLPWEKTRMIHSNYKRSDTQNVLKAQLIFSKRLSLESSELVCSPKLKEIQVIGEYF